MTVVARAVLSSLLVGMTGLVSGGVRLAPALITGTFAAVVTLIRTVSGLTPIPPMPRPKPVTLLEHTENDYLAGRLTFAQFEQRANDLIESGQEDKVLPAEARDPGKPSTL